MFFSYRLLSLLPILSRFWNQSILAEDRIYFFTGAGIKLRQYADMLLSVTSVDAISVTDLALCHIHFRHPLLSTSGPSVQKSEDDEADVPEIEAYKSSQTASFAGSAGGGTKFCRTSYEKMYDPLQNNVTRPTEECTHVLQNDAGYPTPNVGTNTYITTETTGENTTQNTKKYYSVMPPTTKFLNKTKKSEI